LQTHLKNSEDSMGG